MKNLNVVVLTGNIGQDATTKVFENGKGVIEFNLAENSSYKDKAGNWQNSTTWHNCKLFTKQENLDKLSKVFKKGLPTTIQGKLTYQSYDKKVAENITAPVTIAYIKIDEFDISSERED